MHTHLSFYVMIQPSVYFHSKQCHEMGKERFNLNVSVSACTHECMWVKVCVCLCVMCLNAPGCCQLSLVGIIAPYVCLWGRADVCHCWSPGRLRTQHNDSFMPACSALASSQHPAALWAANMWNSVPLDYRGETTALMARHQLGWIVTKSECVLFVQVINGLWRTWWSRGGTRGSQEALSES